MNLKKVSTIAFMGIVSSLVEMSQGWKARSTANARGHRA